MGRYQPRVQPLGRLLDEILLHHVAEGTVRAFLRQVAVALEADEAEPQVAAGARCRHARQERSANRHAS
jgi:hypothetical protein